jgi:hypothetical protein
MLQGTDSVPVNSRQGGPSRDSGTHQPCSQSARERSSGPSLTTGCAVLRVERYYGRLRLPPGRCPLPGSAPVIEKRCPRQHAARFGRGGSPQFPPSPSERSVPTYAGESLAAAFQDLHRFHGLRREPPGSALSRCLTTRQASLPLRTAQLLPPTGLSTLGSSPARFQTEPPACYRAPWRLPGPDSHRQATTSFRSGHDRWTTTSVISGRTGWSTKGQYGRRTALPGTACHEYRLGDLASRCVRGRLTHRD